MRALPMLVIAGGGLALVVLARRSSPTYAEHKEAANESVADFFKQKAAAEKAASDAAKAKS